MNGHEQEIIVPGDQVETLAAPAAWHEAGHIVTAHHFGARVFGIAIGFLPDRSGEGMFLQAIYGWKESTEQPIETACVVKAAGPAADILFRGLLDQQAASGDVSDIAALTGKASLEPFLATATSVLRSRAAAVNCIAQSVRRALEDLGERTLGPLPNNHIGVALVDEETLMSCLATNRTQAAQT